MSNLLKIVVAGFSAIALGFVLPPSAAAQQVPPRKVTLEQMEALYNGMTVEQRQMFNEYLELQRKLIILESAPDSDDVPNAAKLRREALLGLAEMSPDQLRRYWRQVPQMLHRMHKQVDPLYVTPDERLAAAKLPAEAVSEIEKLLSDDIETYLNARRRVLARGTAAKALIAEQARKLGEGSDKRLRLAGVFRDIDNLTELERRARVTEQALRRTDQLRKAQGNKPSRITFLVARDIAERGHHPDEDPYARLPYFNFPKGNRRYDGAVSLLFGNGEADSFDFSMVGGQDHRAIDLGPVDFDSVKKAPNAKVTDKWMKDRGDTIPAAVGHVYMEHCLVPQDGVNMTVKFKVLDLKPGEWVVIEWESIPQEK